MESVALLEVSHLTPSLMVADRCLKTAQVELVGIENSDSGALCLKLRGMVDAVRAAAENGVALAKRLKSFAAYQLLTGPDVQALPILFPAPVFNPLLSIHDALVPSEKKNGGRMETLRALGLLETQGLVAALHATDVMLKAAEVKILGKEKIGAGYVTIMVCGDLAAVQAAVDAGKRTVEQLGGKLILADVISNPHPELAALLPK